MKNQISEELINEAIDIISSRILNKNKEEALLPNQKMRLYASLAKEYLAKKYISPTMFEKDKKLITSIIFIENDKFSIITEGNELFQKITFEQLQELVQIGACQENENDFVDNTLFIVK